MGRLKGASKMMPKHLLSEPKTCGCCEWTTYLQQHMCHVAVTLASMECRPIQRPDMTVWLFKDTDLPRVADATCMHDTVDRTRLKRSLSMPIIPADALLFLAMFRRACEMILQNKSHADTIAACLREMYKKQKAMPSKVECYQWDMLQWQQWIKQQISSTCSFVRNLTSTFVLHEQQQSERSRPQTRSISTTAVSSSTSAKDQNHNQDVVSASAFENVAQSETPQASMEVKHQQPVSRTSGESSATDTRSTKKRRSSSTQESQPDASRKRKKAVERRLFSDSNSTSVTKQKRRSYRHKTETEIRSALQQLGSRPWETAEEAAKAIQQLDKKTKGRVLKLQMEWLIWVRNAERPETRWTNFNLGKLKDTIIQILQSMLILEAKADNTTN